MAGGAAGCTKEDSSLVVKKVIIIFRLFSLLHQLLHWQLLRREGRRAGGLQQHRDAAGGALLQKHHHAGRERQQELRGNVMVVGLGGFLCRIIGTVRLLLVSRLDVGWEETGCHVTEEGVTRCTCETDRCNAPLQVWEEQMIQATNRNVSHHFRRHPGQNQQTALHFIVKEKFSSYYLLPQHSILAEEINLSLCTCAYESSQLK